MLTCEYDCDSGFGRGTPPGSWPDTNAFLGKPADTTTGLNAIGARQYDPATGRFLSLDHILNPRQPPGTQQPQLRPPATPSPNPTPPG